jgi:hypothetical protein
VRALALAGVKRPLRFASALAADHGDPSFHRGLEARRDLLAFEVDPPTR